jgi:hypothetical protein
MRLLLILLLAVHGIAHLAGFVVPWRLLSLADLPYRTTIFGGAVDLGAIGVRAMGLVWLLTGAAFVVVAGAVVVDAAWWYRAFLITAVVSTSVCVVEWPQARTGVLANAVVFAVAVAIRAAATVRI